MTEAAKKVIEYANQTLGLKIIDAYTHKDNLSSTNLLQELKFKNINSVENTNSNLMLFRLNIDTENN